MQMTESEIAKKFRLNGGSTDESQRHYIDILAQLNCVEPDDIRDIIAEQQKKEKQPKQEVAKINIPEWVREKKISNTKEQEKQTSIAKCKSTDGILDVLIHEAVACYICSMIEDNERLNNLRIRQGKYGRIFDSIDNRIEVNEQKIAVMREWVNKIDRR